MILFINTLWKKAYLWLFDKNREKINEIFFEIKWNESSLLLPKLEDFPVIKSSSKRDSFFQKDKNSLIEIIENEKILEYLKEKNISKINWDWSLENIEILEKIDYYDIIKKIELKQNKKVEALYIKKPNIC